MLHKSRFFTRQNSVAMAIGLAFAVVANSQVAAHDHGGMPRSSAPGNARVYFIQPSDGQVLTSGTVKVVFGLEGMGVAPAGTDLANTGHHHLLIDLDQLPDMNAPLPASDQVIHFGKAQTETQLTLAPGVHRLQLLLGNYAHVPHNPPVLSEVIEIEVIAE
tara:strand:- start:857 stop:1339 length:483 start_codon:yes stop_codon:yes gene_type:complete